MNMKSRILAVTAAALVALSAGAANAQYDHQGDHHGGQGGQRPGWGLDYGGGGHNWRRGERMGYNDWSGAQPLNYREHHLRRPPHGYEWRESNGRYILAAVATGAIMSIIMSGNR
jgi:Ni/Co efflux regulator RcnB